MKNFFKFGYYLLALLVLVFALLLLLMQTQVLPGFEVRIVQSGSMEPTIKTGSLVIVHAQASYQMGDIITFGGESPRELPTTHRVLGDQVQDGEVVFITKGDANEEIDLETVPISTVRGKVILIVPYLGYLLDFARQPVGFVLLIGVPAALIVFEEIHNIYVSLRRRKDEDTL